MTYRKSNEIYQQAIKKINVNLDEQRRLIVISDIHGNYPLLRQLLIHCHYTKDDYLVIVGDMLERGNYSLETLRYLRHLSTINNVLMVVGNNDYKAISALLYGNDTELFEYYLHANNTMLYQMVLHYGYDLSNIDILSLSTLRSKIIEDFHDDITFIMSLPHVIETSKYIFVHAGIYQNATVWELLNTKLFYAQQTLHNKLTFVGHYPVSAFYHYISSYMPIIDLKRNIICLDGGNTIKDDGQLNAVIIEPNGVIKSKAVSNLETATIVKDFKKIIQYPVSWIWEQDVVVKVKDDEKYGFYQGKGFFNNKVTVRIAKPLVYQKEGKLFTYDVTNFQPSVKKGDRVSIVYRYDDKLNTYAVVVNGVRGNLPKNILCSLSNHLSLATYLDFLKIIELTREPCVWCLKMPSEKIVSETYHGKRLYKFVIDEKIVGCVLLQRTKECREGFEIINIIVNQKNDEVIDNIIEQIIKILQEHEVKGIYIDINKNKFLNEMLSRYGFVQKRVDQFMLPMNNF